MDEIVRRVAESILEAEVNYWTEVDNHSIVEILETSRIWHSLNFLNSLNYKLIKDEQWFDILDPFLAFG